jgi:hydroxyacylglutathione hydrolase
MSGIASFICNPFQENTYIVHDQNGKACIIDPGCYTREEKDEIRNYIEAQQLTPVSVINTHCHIDHVLGNHWATDEWNIPLYMHKDEVPVMRSVLTYADTMGIAYDASPEPSGFLDEGQTVEVGELVFKVFFTPGHSPASICLYNEKDGYVLGGDVLFLDSIGRTDLPGGDMDTLLRSIRTKLFPLPDDTVVYSGHGPSTTIGREKKYNPFLV